jgi:hypothetical protein
MSYQLQDKQSVWTDAQFEYMAWNEVRIYSTAFVPESYEFCLDLDYIFERILPAQEGGDCKFHVAPATQRFLNVSNLRFDVEIDVSSYAMEIVEVKRTWIGKTPDGELDTWMYVIVLNGGAITLVATGYEMALRAAPVLSEYPELGMRKFPM